MTLWTRLVVLWSRAAAVLSGRRLDRDFNSELRSHLAMLTEEHVRRGLPPEEATRQARLRLGGVAQLEERHRAARGLPLVETTMQDLRYAIRALRKNPAYAGVAIATLAIGIGATTAMFIVVRAVLLRPLPYATPGQLIEVSEVNPLKGWTRTVAAPANLADWRARNTVFTDIAGYIGFFDDRGASRYQLFLTGAGETQPLKGILAMGNLFDVLGVRPLVGRTFTFDETFEGRDRVVVLAYGTWQNVFGGDPQIAGRITSASCGTNRSRPITSGPWGSGCWPAACSTSATGLARTTCS